MHHVFVLQLATETSRSGFHNVVLRSLRQLRDPQLKPLYEYLSTRDELSLRVHGILGLAEISEDRHLDLRHVAAIDSPHIQAELLGAAQDSDLLTVDQAEEMTNWADLDSGVALVLAARLIQEGRWKDMEPLKEGLNADLQPRRALAAALLTQLGDNSGENILNALVSDPSPKSQQTMQMMLNSALRWEMDKLGPWAMRIAEDPSRHLKDRVFALSVAMRFDVAGSEALWQQLYESSTEPAQRNRLAIAALKLSPWIGPTVFEQLQNEEDPLLSAIGNAGFAVSNQQGVAEAVVGLVEQTHPLCNDWALGYAAEKANETDQELIFLALILAFEQGDQRGSELRLDYAITATQGLVEHVQNNPQKYLRPILHNVETSEKLRMGMLLGLIRAREGDASGVIAGWKDTNLPTLDGLALLLRAKVGQPLTDEELDKLGLMARGGGGIDLGLRVQAVWSYLKLTDQADLALQQVLDQQR